MTALFALDTNGYGEILAGTQTGGRLRALTSRERSRLVVLLPVVSELLQRVATPQQHQQILTTVRDPVPAHRRLAPSGDDWVALGKWVSTLAAGGHDPNELKRRSFYLDLHIAVMCRARGITLLTRDQDHARITPHVGHKTEPFPA